MKWKNYISLAELRTNHNYCKRPVPVIDTTFQFILTVNFRVINQKLELKKL